MVLCDYIVGGGHWRSRETSITHVYFNFYIQCPSPSSLVGRGIGGHDGLVNSAFAAVMSGGFILGHVLAGAPDLMMLLPVIAGGASMPQWDVISTGETIIQIIEMFVRIGVVPIVRGGGWDASCHRYWCRWNISLDRSYKLNLESRLHHALRVLNNQRLVCCCDYSFCSFECNMEIQARLSLNSW